MPDEPTDVDLAAVFGQLVEAKGDNNPDPTPNPKPPPPASFAESPEGKAMAAEIADLKRKATEREAAERASRAATFAEVAKSTGRITPALEADLAALFGQALADDAAHEAKVTFSEGSAAKQGSRLDALVAFVAKLPKHRLIEDLIDPKGRPAEGTTALFNRSDADPGSDLAAYTARQLALLYPEPNGSAR